MPVYPTMEARVKESYRMGAVMAFSGHEYTRSEWRPVPRGFEAAALVHPLLDVREVEKEIQVTAKDRLAKTPGTADLKVASTPRDVVGEAAVTTVTDEPAPTEEIPVTEETPAAEEIPADKEPLVEPEQPKARPTSQRARRSSRKGE